MEKDIRTITSGIKKITLTETPHKLPSPPPIRACKTCHANSGSDETGLCASCDPTNSLWFRKNSS
jgi:hypothetical protein